MRLVAKVREATGLELSLRALFEHQTVHALANSLKESPSSAIYDPLILIKKGADTPPLFCVHPAGGSSLVFGDFCRVLGTDNPVYGLQARGIAYGEGHFVSFMEMIQAYSDAIKKIRPEGEIHLLGYSAGGVIAHELAVSLSEQGRDIGFVGIIDSVPPEPNIDSATKNSKEALIKTIVGDDGSSTEGLSTSELYDRLLARLIERKYLPHGADIHLIVRMIEEMLLSEQRIAEHEVRQADFDIHFFLAAAEAADAMLSRRRQSWDRYCRRVEVFPINEMHSKMLDPVPAAAIATVVSDFLTKKYSK
jgi:thioesterase domain-containing protein